MPSALITVATPAQAIGPLQVPFFHLGVAVRPAAPRAIRRRCVHGALTVPRSLCHLIGAYSSSSWLLG